LIELLVVVSIIGLLVTLSITAVKSAMDRAKDSIVKNDCYQIKLEAARINARNFSFDDLCDGTKLNETDPILYELLIDIRKANGNYDPICHTTGDKYCVSALLFTGNTHCVDYTGYSGEGLSVCDSSARCH